MVTALLLSHLQSSEVLDRLYERVLKLKGVEIDAELVRPSANRFRFQIAPGKAFVAHYATSVMYHTPLETVTYMPDRNMYVRAKTEPGGLLPVGFEPFWPSGARLKPTGPATQTQFHEVDAWEQPCVTDGGQALRLYVSRKTNLPLGSIAAAGGATYEVVYRSVKERTYSAADRAFRPPVGSKPMPPGPPKMPEMARPGTRIPDFSGLDDRGKKLSSAALRKQYPNGMVLNFWFCGCKGCIEEMPYLRGLAPKLAKAGIGFVGVDPIDPAPNVRKTSQLQKLGYPTLVGKAANGLRESVKVEVYPTTVILDARGTVVDVWIGFDEARLLKGLTSLGYTTSQ